MNELPNLQLINRLLPTSLDIFIFTEIAGRPGLFIFRPKVGLRGLTDCNYQDFNGRPDLT